MVQMLYAILLQEHEILNWLVVSTPLENSSQNGNLSIYLSIYTLSNQFHWYCLFLSELVVKYCEWTPQQARLSELPHRSSPGMEDFGCHTYIGVKTIHIAKYQQDIPVGYRTFNQNNTFLQGNTVKRCPFFLGMVSWPLTRDTFLWGVGKSLRPSNGPSQDLVAHLAPWELWVQTTEMWNPGGSGGVWNTHGITTGQWNRGVCPHSVV